MILNGQGSLDVDFESEGDRGRRAGSTPRFEDRRLRCTGREARIVDNTPILVSFCAPEEPWDPGIDNFSRKPWPSPFLQISRRRRDLACLPAPPMPAHDHRDPTRVVPERSGVTIPSRGAWGHGRHCREDRGQAPMRLGAQRGRSDGFGAGGLGLEDTRALFSCHWLHSLVQKPFLFPTLHWSHRERT